PRPAAAAGATGRRCTRLARPDGTNRAENAAFPVSPLSTKGRTPKLGPATRLRRRTKAQSPTGTVAALSVGSAARWKAMAQGCPLDPVRLQTSALRRAARNTLLPEDPPDTSSHP